MNGCGILWWLEYGGETAPPHILEQFGFMARLIDEWTRVHGKVQAYKMLRTNDWHGVAYDAVEAAFGR